MVGGPDRLAVPQRGYMEEERHLGRAARRLGEEAVGQAGQAPRSWDGLPQRASGRCRQETPPVGQVWDPVR
jgi:hypothetical protein